MKHIVLIVLFGCANGQLSCRKPTEATCNKTVLDCCESNFRTALNLNSSTCNNLNVYQNVSCYRSAIEAIYFGQGADGVLDVCDAYNNFLSCLDVSIRSCTTYGWYMKQGIPDDILVNILYQNLMYQCGPGLEFFLNNEQCMNTAYSNNVNTLSQCRADFLRRIGTNPPPTSQELCFISTLFVDCYSFSFRTCGDGGLWWGCEIARKSTNVLFPVCDTLCSTQLF